MSDQRESSPVLAYVMLAGGMAIFGSGTPISKVVTDAFPAFLASGARMALATAFLAPALLWTLRAEGGRGPISILRDMDGADRLRLAGIAFAGMFLFSLLMLYGMREISGAVGGIVMATTPAVTAAGSVLFLRERLTRWTAIAIALAVGGVLAVNLGGGSAEGSGDEVVLGTALVLGAVCGEAAYTLLGKRLTAELRPLAVAAFAAVLATLLFLPLAAAQAARFDPSDPDLGEWLALAWWGIGTMAIGSLVWYAGLQRVRGATASAFMGVMPVSALLLSYLLLGESFAPVHAIGMALVLLGIASVAFGEHRSATGGSGR